MCELTARGISVSRGIFGTRGGSQKSNWLEGESAAEIKEESKDTLATQRMVSIFLQVLQYLWVSNNFVSLCAAINLSPQWTVQADSVFLLCPQLLAHTVLLFHPHSSA